MLPVPNTIARNANHWKIICWYDDQNPWYIVLLLVIHSLPPHLLQCNKILLTVWGPGKDWVALEPLHLQHLLWMVNKHYNRKYYHTQSNHKTYLILVINFATIISSVNWLPKMDVNAFNWRYGNYTASKSLKVTLCPTSLFTISKERYGKQNWLITHKQYTP